MAPEIFRKAGHGKPVDIWAIGVITYVPLPIHPSLIILIPAYRYFLLCGYTPFDRDSQYEEMQAIIRGDYKFEPASTFLALQDQSANGFFLALVEGVLAGSIRGSQVIRPEMLDDRSDEPSDRAGIAGRRVAQGRRGLLCPDASGLRDGPITASKEGIRCEKDLYVLQRLPQLPWNR